MTDPSLLGESRTKILERLLARNTTAAEIASALAVQVSAARKHLEQLQRLGLVGEEFRKGHVGRPKKFYYITDKGKELFPRKYDMILNEVVAKLVEHQGSDYAESLMNRIAEDKARAMNLAGPAGKRSSQHILQSLNELGFDADIKEDKGHYVVTSRNCPLLKTAQAHREIICRGLHEELLKSALGASEAHRENWIVEGDSYCKHIVSKNGPHRKKQS